MSEEQTTAPSAAAAGGGAASGDAEESTATFEPVVHLEEVETETGEEDENVEFKMRAKLYRYCESLLDVGTGNKQWNDRGIGDVRFMKHKETGKIRLLMRREKTLKVCANFHVKPGTKIEEHAGSEKARVMVVVDCSDGDERPELYNMCIKFGSAEKRELFTAAFNDAQKKMAALPAEEGEAEAAEEKAQVAEEADALADALTATKVEEKKDEE